MRPRQRSAGYAMAALLVMMAVMAVVMSVAMPAWSTLSQRERETELIFRGQQYARAITLFQRKFANTFPPNVDVLLEQRMLRRKFKDPITNDDFQLLYAGNTTPGQAAQQGQGQQGGARQGQPLGGRGRGAAAPATPPANGRQGLQGGLNSLAGETGGVPGQLGQGGRAGINGVASKSTATSLRAYNGRTKYNEWTFIALQAQTNVAPPGGPPRRGQGPGGRGTPGGVPARGFGPGGSPAPLGTPRGRGPGP